MLFIHSTKEKKTVVMYYTKKKIHFTILLHWQLNLQNVFFFPHTYLLFYTVHIDEGSTVEH